MDLDQRNGQADSARLETLLVEMREELRDAIRAQEQL